MKTNISELNSFKSNEEKIKFIQKANFTSNLYRSYLIDQRVKKILKGVTMAGMLVILSSAF